MMFLVSGWSPSCDTMRGKMVEEGRALWGAIEGRRVGLGGWEGRLRGWKEGLRGGEEK